MGTNSITKGIICSFLSGLSWSIIPILSKLCSNEVETITIIFVRYFFSLPMVLLVCWYKKNPVELMKTKHLLLGILSALCLCLNFYFYTQGIVITNASNSQIVIQTGVLIFCLSSIIVFREKINILQTGSILLSILGFYIFYVGQKENFSLDPTILQKGNYLVMLSGCFWACFALIQKYLSKFYRVETILIVIFASANLFVLPFINLESIFSISSFNIFIMFLCGFLTFTSYVFLGMAQKLIPAAQVSSMVSLNPLLTLLFLIILNIFHVTWYPLENLSGVILIGSILVVSGVLGVNYYKTKIPQG